MTENDQSKFIPTRPMYQYEFPDPDMTISPVLKDNWYEERFFHADTRADNSGCRVRPRDDEIENIPRITRKALVDAPVFFPDKVDPMDQYLTTHRRDFVKHRDLEMTLTERRMNTSAQELQEMLSVKPDRFIPDYSLKPISKKEQYQTTHREYFKRFI